MVIEYILMVYAVCMEPREITTQFYGIIEKRVGLAGREGSAGRIYVPNSWRGKKVIILLQEPLNNNAGN